MTRKYVFKEFFLRFLLAFNQIVGPNKCKEKFNGDEIDGFVTGCKMCKV